MWLLEGLKPELAQLVLVLTSCHPWDSCESVIPVVVVDAAVIVVEHTVVPVNFDGGQCYGMVCPRCAV